MSENADRDPFLEKLAGAVAEEASKEQPTRSLVVAVMCEGMTITGQVISEEQYLQRFREACATYLSKEVAGGTEEITGRFLAPAKLDVAKESEPHKYIHFADARVLNSPDAGKLWRVRLSAVSAFSFVNFT